MNLRTSEELYMLALHVAHALGFEWQYADEQPYNHRRILVGPDGVSLNLAWVQSDNDRLRILGRWPKPVQRGNRLYDFHPHDRPSITVAADKSPNQIAGDIRRRFLPKYLPLWQEAVEAREAKLAEIEKLDSMLTLLMETPNVRKDRNEDGVRFGEYKTVYGDAEVHSGGTVSLKIHNLPFEVACEVLKRILLR